MKYQINSETKTIIIYEATVSEVNDLLARQEFNDYTVR